MLNKPQKKRTVKQTFHLQVPEVSGSLFIVKDKIFSQTNGFYIMTVHLSMQHFWQVIFGQNQMPLLEHPP